MRETAIAPSVDPDAANEVRRSLADLEHRVQTLETRVAALPDSRQIEERVTERVKASIPPSAPSVDPSQAPSLKDISLPIPNMQAIVSTAKTTWALLEMMAELKLLFWMLVDRRYHMGWLTRVITIGLVALILLSHFLTPFAKIDNFVSPIWDKFVDLFLGVVLFTLLNIETRRYKQWRNIR